MESKSEMEKKNGSKNSNQSRMTDEKKEWLDQNAKNARYIDRASCKFKILLLCMALFLIGLAGNEAVDAGQEFGVFKKNCRCKATIGSSPFGDQICIGESFRVNGLDVLSNNILLEMSGYGPEQPCICRTRTSFNYEVSYDDCYPVSREYTQSPLLELFLETIEARLTQLEISINELDRKFSILDDNIKRLVGAQREKAVESNKQNLEKISASKTESNSSEEISSNVERRDIPVVIAPFPCQDKYGEYLHGVTCMAP